MWLLAFTTFAASALVFWLEPLVARLALPRYGGAPAVWNTCVLMFQACLLLGYLYAHLLGARFSARRQVLVHLALAIVAGAVLPLSLGESLLDPAHSPISSLLLLLLVRVAPPFLMLSATAPLVQRWAALCGARNPYRLYAASNLGSALGLFAFPFLLEPLFALDGQRVAWTTAYALYLLLIGFVAWRLRSRTELPAAVETKGPPIAWRQRALWTARAFVPSSLMLGVTGHITTDLAAVPLLWIVPLGLYLFTFVFAFARDDGGPVKLLSRVFQILVVVQLVLMVAQQMSPMWPLLALHLATFAVGALAFHGALSADRPHPSRLTEFYLWVSFGGVLGGVFNGLLAPVVFDSIAEYPIALVLGLALLPDARHALRRPAAIGAALLGVWWLLYVHDERVLWLERFTLFVAPITLAILFFRSPRRLAFAAGPMLVAQLTFGLFGDVLLEQRSFFGVHRVVTLEGDGLGLMHGSTLHGIHLPGEGALLYFSPLGPLGDVLTEDGPPRRLAVVGLGTGCMTAYAREQDELTWFEIDPLVVQIAREHFPFLAEAKAPVSWVLGDARLELARRDATYDVLVIDAFSSDAIPVHLLTREAFRDAYLPRLAPGGRLVMHVSSRYFDLVPVVSRLAADAGLVGKWRLDPGSGTERHASSTWVALAREESSLDGLGAGWLALSPTGEGVWTDSWSNLLAALR